MMTRALLEGLREFDTALLANTLDTIDPTPAEAFYMSGDIQSLTPDLGPTVGVAVTCQVDTSTPGGAADWAPYHAQIDRIAAMSLPVVWVVETVGARPEHECVTGDGMGKTLYAAGCLGVVTNGFCRDIAGCRTVPFSVHGRGTIAHHCAIRFTAMDVAVHVGGIEVRPGDIVHADREGVIRIPESAAESVLAQAPAMRALEHEAHAYLRRRDVSAGAKVEHVSNLFIKYGFRKA